MQKNDVKQMISLKQKNPEYIVKKKENEEWWGGQE